MRNKKNNKKVSLEEDQYVLTENDIAQNAKYQLNTISCEEDKAKFLIRKFNGWSQIELSSSKPFPNPKITNQPPQKSLDKLLKRKCKTNQHDYVSFRYCEKLYDEAKQAKVMKNVKKWKKKQQIRKPQLTFKNITPVFTAKNKQQENKLKTRNNITNHLFMGIRRSITPRNQILKSQQELTLQEIISEDKRGKTNIKQMKLIDAEITQVNPILPNKHLPKHKILKSNFPSYFDFKNTEHNEISFLKSKLSPKFSSLVSQQYQQSNRQIKQEFIEYLRRQKRRCSTQTNEGQGDQCWFKEGKRLKPYRFRKQKYDRNRKQNNNSLKSII